MESNLHEAPALCAAARRQLKRVSSVSERKASRSSAEAARETSIRLSRVRRDRLAGKRSEGKAEYGDVSDGDDAMQESTVDSCSTQGQDQRSSQEEEGACTFVSHLASMLTTPGCRWDVDAFVKIVEDLVLLINSIRTSGVKTELANRDRITSLLITAYVKHGEELVGIEQATGVVSQLLMYVNRTFTSNNKPLDDIFHRAACEPSVLVESLVHLAAFAGSFANVTLHAIQTISLLVFVYGERCMPAGSTIEDMLKILDPVGVLSKDLGSSDESIAGMQLHYPYLKLIRDVCYACAFMPANGFGLLCEIFEQGVAPKPVLDLCINIFYITSSELDSNPDAFPCHLRFFLALTNYVSATPHFKIRNQLICILGDMMRHAQDVVVETFGYQEEDGRGVDRLQTFVLHTLLLQDRVTTSNVLSFLSELCSTRHPSLMRAMQVAGVGVSILECFRLQTIPTGLAVFHAASIVWSCVMSCLDSSEVAEAYGRAPVLALMCTALGTSLDDEEFQNNELGRFDVILEVLCSISEDEAGVWKHQLPDFGELEKVYGILTGRDQADRASAVEKIAASFSKQVPPPNAFC